MSEDANDFYKNAGSFLGGGGTESNDMFTNNNHQMGRGASNGSCSVSGYRSNELDEGNELQKLNALNAIACH